MCGWGQCVVFIGRLFSLSFFSSGFQDLLRMKPTSLLILLGCISISMASLIFFRYFSDSANEYGFG
jgi:hypothetical protein